MTQLQKHILINNDFLQHKDFFINYSCDNNQDQILLNGSLKKIYTVSKNTPKEISPVLVKNFFTYKEKRYIIPRFGKPYKRMTAKHAHNIAKKLNNPTQTAPISYAAILYKKGVFHHHSIEFQEYIQNPMTFLEHYDFLKPFKKNLEAIKKAASLLAYIHNRQIGHLDLASKNMIMNDNLCYFIDLDTMMFCRSKYNPLMLICTLSDLNTFAKSIIKNIGSLHTKAFFLYYAKDRKWTKKQRNFIYFLLEKKFFE